MPSANGGIVHADLLPQASLDARLRVGELDALGADPTPTTDDPPLRIHERHAMRPPRASRPTSDPGSIARDLCVGHSHCRCSNAPHAFEPNRQTVTHRLVPGHDPKSRQSQNPRTITKRSHRSSLVGCTSREDTIESSMASGVAFLFVRGPAVRAATVRRGAGVKAEARRGRATRGAWTPVTFCPPH